MLNEHLANLGVELYHFKSLTSTQDIIKRILASKKYINCCPQNKSNMRSLAVLADHQTSGRGRLPGRFWISPTGGNLYATVGIRCVWSSNQIKHFSFLVLCAVIDVLKGLLQSDKLKLVKVKWPNDLFLNGKKLCGILTELWDNEDNQPWFLIGVGLNVVSSPEGASRLSDYISGKIKVISLLQSLISSLYNEIDEYNKYGFDPIRRKWLDFAWRLGEVVSINDGEYSGRFSDIDRDGALVLQGNKGQETKVLFGSLT